MTLFATWARRCAAAGVVVALAGGAPAKDADRRIGDWRIDGRDAGFVRFEESRVRVFEKGRLSFFHALYAKDTVALWTWTTKVTWKTAFDGAALRIDAGSRSLALRRLDKAPEELELTPLPLGKAGAVPAARLAEIKADLAKREQEDQAVRTDPARARDMRKVDAENTAWLRDLVKGVGWIDAKRFGAPAANAAFLIVQHSGDMPLMLAALPEIERDVKAKLLDAQNFALLWDRTQLNLGLKQRYGSQCAPDSTGNLVVLPLEDRANVERIRREAGLFALSKYLEYMKPQNGGRPVGFLEWE